MADIVTYWKNHEMKESFITEVRRLIEAEDGSIPGEEIKFYCDIGGSICSDHNALYLACIVDPKRRVSIVDSLYNCVFDNDEKRQEAVLFNWRLPTGKANWYFYRYVLYRIITIFTEYNKNAEDKKDLTFLLKTYKKLHKNIQKIN